MTLLVAWLLICVAITWFARREPLRIVSIAIVTWAAIPSIATSLVTGQTSGPLAIHPATWLLLTATLIQLLHDGPSMTAALGRHVHLVLAVGVFATGAALTSQLNGSGGLKLLGDQIVGPALLFWLVVAHGPTVPDRLTKLRTTVLAVVAFECALGIMQSFTNDTIFYEKYYLELPWFDPLKFDRAIGTTDSPLVLSFAICVAAPLLVGLRNQWWRFGLLSLFFVGVVVTQSRTGLGVMSLIVLLVVLRSRMTVLVRSVYLLSLSVAAVALLRSGLTDGVTSRFSNDTGSSQARVAAVEAFVQRFHEFVFTGTGLTSSYEFSDALNLRSSLESTYLMYIVDTGLILSTVYFGAQLGLLAKYGPGWHIIRGAATGAFVGCVLQQTFSAMAASNLAGTMLWCMLGMTTASSLAPRQPPAGDEVGDNFRDPIEPPRSSSNRNVVRQ